MALNSFSQFIYIDPVDDQNFYLNFDEGLGELTAEVEIGEYTITSLADAVAVALNSVGANSYQVTLDRASRTYTISADANFALLISSGTQNGVDIFPLLGFTGADTSQALSHTSNVAAGAVFAPQYKLQDYVPSENFQEATSAAVSTTARGDVEVVKFGTTKFIECSIQFSTDICQPKSGPIRNNPTGVADLRSFLQFATNKFPFEFVPDENAVGTFETVLLESIPGSRDGTGYKMRELFDSGLPGYFETGVLTLRVIEEI
jgi:hypothetical protein